MNEPTAHDSEGQPQQPDGLDWRTIAVRVGVVLLVVLGVLLLFKLLRRGGAGVVLAAAAPVAASRFVRRLPTGTRRTRQKIDQDFLQAALRTIGEGKPLMTPAELCPVLNTCFARRGLAGPFQSPQHLAHELKKLGLHSSVRTVPGRAERRWYDLSDL